MAGLHSLGNVTRWIYYVGSTKEDVYIIDDFSKVK
jgi:hypothetical protein